MNTTTKVLLRSTMLLFLAVNAIPQTAGVTSPDIRDSPIDPARSDKLLTVIESWVRLDGGSTGATIAIDSSGNVHSAGIGGGILLKSYTPSGQLSHSTAFPGRSVSHMVLDSVEDLILVGRKGSPAPDMLVMKVRTDGVTIWEKVIPSFNSAVRVATNDQDDIYVIGSNSGSSSSRNYVTIKLDPNGNILWTRMYDGPNNFDDQARFLDVDRNGQVAVTGYSSAGGSGRDAATVVYDASGNRLWTARFEGSGIDEANCVAFDSAGAVYMSGETNTGVGFGPDLLLVKYDAAGVEQWVRTYDGPISAGDYGTRVEVTSNDDVVVIGDSGGTVTVNSVLLKFDSMGNHLWTRRHSSGTFSEVPLATALGTDDRIYVTGQGGFSQSSYITFCYAADGSLVWEQLYESASLGGNNRATAIALGPSGAVAVTGRVPFTTIRYREFP